MKERDNVGVIDTAIRAIIACLLLALAIEQVFTLPVTIVMALLGSALWLSCVTGVCLAYRVLGIDTYHAKC